MEEIKGIAAIGAGLSAIGAGIPRQGPETGCTGFRGREPEAALTRTRTPTGQTHW